jgi:hypothetical protein
MICWNFCAAKIQPQNSAVNKHTKGSPLKKRLSWRSPRHRATYVFAVLFLSLTILLCIRLNEWDFSVPGKCYNTYLTSSPSAPHPGIDKAYVGITASWLLVTMFSAVFGPPKQRRSILAISFVQFPVHLYMMIALRTENQELLGGESRGGEGDEAGAGSGEKENGWDFGQTAAVLLLLITVNELLTKGWEFWKWEKALNSGSTEHGDAKEGGETARQMESEAEQGRAGKTA